MRTRASRIRRQNTVGVLLLSGVGLIFAIGFAVYMTIDRSRQHGCAAAGPSSLTAVIVDSTDQLTAVQRLALENELIGVVDNLPVGGGIQFWRVAPSSKHVPEAEGAVVCNPGKTTSQWTGNPAKVQKSYQNNFYTPSVATVRRLVSAHSEAESPIMETIQAVALRVFGAPEFAAVKDRRLVLASDLLQNSPTLNQLATVGPFEEFRHSDGFERVAAPLNNVNVEVLYLRRERSPQGKVHIEFWQSYIAANGGILIHLKSIAGVS